MLTAYNEIHIDTENEALETDSYLTFAAISQSLVGESAFRAFKFHFSNHLSLWLLTKVAIYNGLEKFKQNNPQHAWSEPQRTR